MTKTLRVLAGAVLAAMGVAAPTQAAVFTFDSDPFAGTTALDMPGRQVIGGEPSLPVFEIANDVLAINTSVFQTGPRLDFFSGPAAAIPATGSNFIVLQTLDGDNDPGNGVALNAGSAADLVANAVTGPGAGFFIYFNSGLDLPRLVFSTDLSSSLADLKVVARFTGLGGQPGRDALPTFSAANVAAVPEPATWALMIGGFGLVGVMARRRSPATAA